MPDLRLTGSWDREEEQKDELAPLPFCPARPDRPEPPKKRDDDETPASIKHAEEALKRAQDLSDELDDLVEEDEAAIFRMSKWLDDDGDDDGPRAA